MNIEIIPLALKKMNQRGITEELVKDVVNFPEQVVEGYMRREVRQKICQIDETDGLLRVVCEEKADGEITVVTAYFTTQVERYWKEGLQNEDRV